VQNLPTLKLIGLDLDGTVLDHHGDMSDAMLAALTACHDAGIHIAFLTGRRPKTTRVGLLRWEHDAFVATNTGCLTWEYPAWKPLQRRLFPIALLPELVELLAPYSVNLYHDAGEDDPGYVHLKRQSTPEMIEVRARFGEGTREIDDLSQLDGEAITQLALPATAEVLLPLQARIRERFGERLSPLVMRWPLVPCLGLEVFDPGGNKGVALASFAGRLGVEATQVAAVGDDANDIAMLEWAGVAVAMPHAQNEVRDAANVLLEGYDSQAALAQWLNAVARDERLKAKG
jgi:Cof subfamily protein (haloacid dehalogenase superfamily)